jgi:CoA:oxalate CoA-transferase
VQSALIKRFRTGRGDYIDATLIESAMALVTGDLQMPQIETDQRIMTFKAVRAKDGWVMPVILTDKAFESLCAVIDPALATDARFDHRIARAKHHSQLRAAIETWTSQRSARLCQDTLMAAGVPCARYATLEDVLDDPHLVARGTFAQLEDAAGPFVVNNAPFRFRESDTAIRSGAPKLGQHTDAVLSQWLNIDPGRIAELARDGVVTV